MNYFSYEWLYERCLKIFSIHNILSVFYINWKISALSPESNILLPNNITPFTLAAEPTLSVDGQRYWRSRCCLQCFVANHSSRHIKAARTLWIILIHVHVANVQHGVLMAAEYISEQPSDESHSLFTIAEYGGELLLPNATTPYAITRFVRCICNADAIKPMTAKPAASNQNECIVGQLLLLLLAVMTLAMVERVGRTHPCSRCTRWIPIRQRCLCVCVLSPTGRSVTAWFRGDSAPYRPYVWNEAPVHSASKICPAGLHV